MAGVGKTPITVDEIRDEELYGVLLAARGESAPLADHVIERKIRAAEDHFEKELRLLWGVKRVAASPRTRGLVKGTDYDVEIPAFNYDREWFMYETWGDLELPFRPVQSIDKMFFTYPGIPLSESFPVPLDWILPDYKYGNIRIVPASGQVVLVGLNAYLISVAAGRGLPRSVVVDFTAGFDSETLVDDHADLLEALRLETTLNLFGIASNIRTGGVQSSSLSLDGLSRSQSFSNGKWGPYSGAVELAMDRIDKYTSAWRETERGVQLIGV